MRGAGFAIVTILKLDLLSHGIWRGKCILQVAELSQKASIVTVV